ncbi:MAG: ABC transporter ATP-binding protein [Bacteroidales bacterium]|nr:ABC transporter ATP-binding protein [Bacteroidales bacterium]
MKDALKIFKRYLPPYKSKITLNIIFNFFGAIFGVFSFVTLIPVLEILFGTQEKVYGVKDIDFSIFPLNIPKDDIIHNIYCYITQLMDTQGSARALVYLGIFFIVLVLFKTGLTFLASFFIVAIRNGVVRDIRNQIYIKIISLPIGFFSEERKGDIISRMTGDVQEIEHSIMNSLEMFFKNPIIILVSLIAMIAMSWQLTLFVFILFPVAGLIIGRIGKSLKRRSMAGQIKMGEILSTVEESISGLRIIKAFNAEKIMQARSRKENEEYRNIMNRLMRRHFLAHPVSEFLGTVLIVSVMWYGGSLILKNESNLSPADFMAYLVIFYSIINPVKAFSSALYSIQKGLASSQRVDKILHATSNIIVKDNPKRISGFTASVQYKNVSFRYNQEYVLKNINLTLEKGKTIAIVGQSGSGKSTLVDLLPRFYDVESGSISIDGIDIRDLRLDELRNLMGIVNQEPILFNDTFYNNIAFGLDHVSEKDVESAAKVANAHEFIINTEFGYHSNIGDRGGKLSGGQRQRISIARAVLKNPPILILDEATSALDTESERLVQDALAKLMKNRTSIVIAHRLSTIVHADEICVMQNGEIIERGKHDELLTIKGEYKKYYDLQYT